ncbi:zeta toxin family protein [Anaerocolumna sp. AGMB13025]|uniref:zeta toxin family protein n=1 Tax=Anaerocolumna sp. AGMB13025 TaxID=3039116 RepID=UPI00241D168D|nr:zeta toxin family protein [Anaerocolumna sp. AGMB13025]WFR59168.1 zeta toxin family protein [Anaerocolumna sp. AGMB13025]
MDQDKVIAIMGSPGSGKTTAALKLALTLSMAKKNVIVVFCDPFTPVIPTVLPADSKQDTSLGSLLTAPALTQAAILNACVPTEKSEFISFLGYQAGESLMMYPQITRDKAVELFVLLRYLADYIIIDCTAYIEADPASIVAIELADRVLRLGTANLKSVSYYLTHNPMLADSRFRKDTHQTVIGNLKAGQDWESVSQQLGGTEFVLPYAPELEQQYDELTLLTQLVQPESTGYTAGIEKLLGIQSVKSKVKPVPPAAADTAGAKQKEKAKGKPAFRLPFAKNRGGF